MMQGISKKFDQVEQGLDLLIYRNILSLFLNFTFIFLLPDVTCKIELGILIWIVVLLNGSAGGKLE